MAVATPLADAKASAEVIYRDIFSTFAEILSDKEFHFINKTI